LNNQKFGRAGICLLPQAMNAQGHQVIHLIIGLGDTGKDTSDTLLLLALGDGLIAKVGRAIGGGSGVAEGIGGGEGADKSGRAS
jgi:hypothetical protein